MLVSRAPSFVTGLLVMFQGDITRYWEKWLSLLATNLAMPLTSLAYAVTGVALIIAYALLRGI